MFSPQLTMRDDHFFKKKLEVIKHSLNNMHAYRANYINIIRCTFGSHGCTYNLLGISLDDR